MKILNSTFSILSKFKNWSITSPSVKLNHVRLKNILSQEAFSLCVVSAFRSMTIESNVSQADSFLRNGGKYFQETENEYAHEVMKKLPDYSASLVMHPLQINKYAVKTELSCNLSGIQKFINSTLDNLSQGTCIENGKHTETVRNVCSSLPQATYEEIKMILHYLCMWPSTSSTMTPNFSLLWNMLDKECVKRINGWDASQQLLIADYWFHLRLSRICKYNQEVIYNLVRNIDSLLHHQIVQLMFLINLQRKIPTHFVSNLEKKLESVIRSVTVEEMGIICLGFFKTKNKISDSKLIESIIKKFMYNVENVNTVTVAAILKFLRKSLNRSFQDLYILTLHKCVGCVSNWDIPTSVHLALLSSECNVYHPLLLNCVSEKLASRIADARIKDCSKLLISLSMYNHSEGKFLGSFLSELQREERQNEINMYPVQVVHAAICCAYMGYFNNELLAKIFDKQFFDKTCLKFPEVCTVFAELDCCVEIECEDYKGPKLDLSVRKALRYHRGNLPSQSSKQNMQTRLLNEIYECLVEIFGNEKNLLIRHILPHMYSPDIIIRLTESGNESLADLYSNYSPEQILRPPSNEVWASLVTGGVYAFAYKSTQMTGITAMKLRQLKQIGYEVMFVPYYNVSQNKTRRKKFLEEKLNELEGNLKSQSSDSSD